MTDRLTARAKVFEGDWHCDGLELVGLRQEGAEVLGSYRGRGSGGTLRGSTTGTRLDFEWESEDKTERGSGFFRARASGERLVGVWARADGQGETLFMTRASLPAHTDAERAAEEDASGLKYRGYDLALGGRCQEAITVLERALDLYGRMTDASETSALMRDNYTIDRLNVLTRLLYCYYELGDDVRREEELYQRLLTHLIEVVELRATLNQRDYLKAVFERQPDTARELTTYIERWRARLRADARKIDAQEKSQTFFHRLVQFFVGLGDVKEALLASESARTRAFMDMLAGRGAGDERQPRDETAPHPALAPPVAFETVARLAAEKRATVVEYFVAGDALHIWVLRPSGDLALRRVELSAAGKPFVQLIGSARLSMGVRGRDARVETKAAAGGNYEEQLRLLHELLIAPVAELLPENADAPVVFIPHGPLFMVPFPALRDERGRYLIERHTPATAPSIQVWAHLRGRPRRETKAGGPVLVVGDPSMPSVRLSGAARPARLRQLPYAREEAEEVAASFGTRAVTGALATKAALLPAMRDRRVIHLATHGLLDDLKGEGMPGAVALAPSAGDDGLLTSMEIMGLSLRAELVVLSACNTGRGLVTGDGVIGLTRAFIVAGAANVVVSLWAVSDASTKRLMVSFYENCRRGLGYAAAMREAMLAFLSKPELRPPAHWAAFTVVGDTR